MEDKSVAHQLRQEVPVVGSIQKRVKSEEYYGVSVIITEKGRRVWGASISSKQLPTLCATEREAAIMVDKLLIKAGKEPRNILKFKQIRYEK